jgi:hypothetical protein
MLKTIPSRLAIRAIQVGLGCREFDVERNEKPGTASDLIKIIPGGTKDVPCASDGQ